MGWSAIRSWLGRLGGASPTEAPTSPPELEEALVAHDWAQALALAEAWHEREPGSPVAAWLATKLPIQLGRAAGLLPDLTEHQDAEAVVAWAEALTERHPRESIGWQLLSYAHSLWGVTRPARVTSRPIKGHARAFFIKADAGDDRWKRRARRAAQKAVRLAPDDPAAYVARAEALTDAERRADALRDCDRALELEPRFIPAYLARGDVYRTDLFWSQMATDGLRLGGPTPAGGPDARRPFDNAVREYTKAIEIDPHCTTAYVARAALYRDHGSDRQAMADHDEAIRLEPTAGHYSRRGSLHLAMKAFEPAVADFTEALRLDPDRASDYHYRACALNALGQHHRAAEDCDAAFRLNPDYLPILLEKSRALAGDGRKAEAAGAAMDLLTRASQAGMLHLVAAAQEQLDRLETA